MGADQMERIQGGASGRRASKSVSAQYTELINALSTHNQRRALEADAEPEETVEQKVERLRALYPMFTGTDFDRIELFEQALLRHGLPKLEALVVEQYLFQDVEVMTGLDIRFCSLVGVQDTWAWQHAADYTAEMDPIIRPKRLESRYALARIGMSVLRVNGSVANHWGSIRSPDRVRDATMSEGLRLAADAASFIDQMADRQADLVSIHSRWFSRRCSMVMRQDVEAILGNG